MSDFELRHSIIWFVWKSIYRMTRSNVAYTKIHIAWSRHRAIVTMHNQFEGVIVELLEGSLSEAGRHLR